MFWKCDLATWIIVIQCGELPETTKTTKSQNFKNQAFRVRVFTSRIYGLFFLVCCDIRSLLVASNTHFFPLESPARSQAPSLFLSFFSLSFPFFASSRVGFEKWLRWLLLWCFWWGKRAEKVGMKLPLSINNKCQQIRVQRRVFLSHHFTKNGNQFSLQFPSLMQSAGEGFWANKMLIFVGPSSHNPNNSSPINPTRKMG